MISTLKDHLEVQLVSWLVVCVTIKKYLNKKIFKL
jgi:hypothetical protein